MSQTLSSILENQSALLEAAAEALPHQFSQCTYSLGYIRQAVYLCITCGHQRGICSACSIACHTDHEQLELFPKRNFRCDCPTSALAHPCTLHKHQEEPNAENTYGQNFRGMFCRCGRPYDAYNERETMIQCLACEDWFHESCLNLRERPPSRPSTPEAEEDHDGAASEASSSGLPPPLIHADDYDALICASCVRDISTFKRYAGISGALMVIRDGESEPWKIIGHEEESTHVDIQSPEDPKAESTPNVGEKRSRSPDATVGSDAKRARVSLPSEQCLAPPPNTRAQEILSKMKSKDDEPGSKSTFGHGDVFLTEGWRERWCRCDACLSSLRSRPYLLDEEETYEPPEDPDSGLSLEELGLRALQRLPRDQAIDGIRAFNEMRDELMQHLRPFAQEGKEVTEADIRAFFDSRMEANQNQ